MKELLSKRLNDIMIKRKVSNTELAKNINMPIQTIQKIRTGVNENPTISTLRTISEYFKISVSQLIGDEPIIFNEVPILSWKQALTWPDFSADKVSFNFLVPTNANKKMFSVIIDDDYIDFGKDEILLVDPAQQMSKNSYVLVNKVGQEDPTIKKILEDEGKLYLKSLIPGINNSVLLSNDYVILGVIIASYKMFSSQYQIK